jgi:hypothetical protein
MARCNPGCECGRHKNARITQVRVGDRFERLEVVDPAARWSSNGQRYAECVCDCGAVLVTRVSALVAGLSKSCGCWRVDVQRARGQTAESLDRLRLSNTTHGLSRHPLYGAWRKMMSRCYNPSADAYRNYGARGISVAPQWHDVAVFVRDIEAELGPRPQGQSLDRVNNDRGYEPGNMQWATASEQLLSRRTIAALEAQVRQLTAENSELRRRLQAVPDSQVHE